MRSLHFHRPVHDRTSRGRYILALKARTPHGTFIAAATPGHLSASGARGAGCPWWLPAWLASPAGQPTRLSGSVGQNGTGCPGARSLIWGGGALAVDGSPSRGAVSSALPEVQVEADGPGTPLSMRDVGRLRAPQPAPNQGAGARAHASGRVTCRSARVRRLERSESGLKPGKPGACSSLRTRPSGLRAPRRGRTTRA